LIHVTGISQAPLEHVLKHLRDDDQQEMEAVRGKFDPNWVAAEFCRVTDGWLFWDLKTSAPVAALGFYPMTQVCVSCWALGTPAWPVKDVTKHVLHVMIPRLLKSGFHRAECRALSSREDTRRWLTSLGWRAEAVLSGFGVRREDFTLFAWTDDEQADHPRRAERADHLPVRRHQ
jgi:hypothetical protein